MEEDEENKSQEESEMEGLNEKEGFEGIDLSQTKPQRKSRINWFAKAENHLLKALKLGKDPQQIAILQAYMKLLLSKNKLDECIQALQIYTECSPQDPAGWREYLQFYLDKFPNNKLKINPAALKLFELDPTSGLAFSVLIQEYKSLFFYFTSSNFNSFFLDSVPKLIPILLKRLLYIPDDEVLWFHLSCFIEPKFIENTIIKEYWFIQAYFNINSIHAQSNSSLFKIFFSLLKYLGF